MPTSNNNRTAERLPSRPLAPAERLPPRPLASNDNYLSSPSVQNNNNNNYYTPRTNSPHSHPPNHKGMRDQSLSLHPYSGRDSDSYGLMTPMSTTNNKTTKSSLISSNHNNNSTISSPPSHHLHHQGYGGATSTFSSHSINITEEYVGSLLALSPLPISSNVPGLTHIQVYELKHILPPEYMPPEYMPPGYFASNNNAFHLAFLAWGYDTILSQPGAALEYLEMHFRILVRCERRYLNYLKAQIPSDMGYMYQISREMDEDIGHRQFAMSLLWHNVWLLQYLPSSTNIKLCPSRKYITPDECEMIGSSIAYWLDKLSYRIIQPYQERIQVIGDELHHHDDMLCQIIDAMHRQEVRRSSPSPNPTTHKRGEESKSMSVVSAPSPTAAPLALSSRLYSTQARTGAVPTQPVSMPHTAKQPPEDASPRRREKSSYAPSLPTHPKEGRGNSSQD